MKVKPKIALASPTSQARSLIEEFQQYLQIDKTKLDEAMASQGDLFFRVGEAYANAVSERDAAKEALNAVDAELSRDCRVPGKTDQKMTEGSIKDIVQGHPQHAQAFELYNNAKHLAERLSALRDAFQERGRMLRDLGNLYATGYFTTTATQGAVANIGRERLREAREGKQ